MSKQKASNKKPVSTPKKKPVAQATPPRPATPSSPSSPIRLDLGCGPNKKEGFIGVDQYEMPGVDVVLDLGSAPWPWGDNTVSEVHCSHFLEHLEAKGRIHFMNELHRVMIPGAQALIITPHWASNRAYGDLTHAWPPVSEMFYYYLNREWRVANAPHTDARWNPKGYTCDFAFGAAYNLHVALKDKNEEMKTFMQTWYKEACQDMLVQMTKPLPAAPPLA